MDPTGAALLLRTGDAALTLPVGQVAYGQNLSGIGPEHSRYRLPHLGSPKPDARIAARLCISRRLSPGVG